MLRLPRHSACVGFVLFLWRGKEIRELASGRALPPSAKENTPRRLLPPTPSLNGFSQPLPRLFVRLPRPPDIRRKFRFEIMILWRGGGGEEECWLPGMSESRGTAADFVSQLNLGGEGREQEGCNAARENWEAGNGKAGAAQSVWLVKIIDFGQPSARGRSREALSPQEKPMGGDGLVRLGLSLLD